MLPDIAVVVIGRNEGERLRACFRSVIGRAGYLVYVDSGSTDRSIEHARGVGIEVVELDTSARFTAARARNEGFRRAREHAPNTAYVQFLDGDCEMVDGWIEKAVSWLDSHPGVAVVCGRRRERHPTHSVYNLLCDIEWDTPVGEAKTCGGDALVRAEAFDALGGFRPDLIAGEEPELCVRLRAGGWRIWRLDADMSLHDAAMNRFGQWWNRSVRGGYAYAQGADLHGAPPERHGVRESHRIWFWGLGIPVATSVLCLGSGAWGSLLLLLYPIQVVRLALHGTRSLRDNWWRAAFLVLGKFPELLGQLKFLFHRYLAGAPRLIEYK
jgi:GT2 family glycosyltransferase